MTTTLLHPNSKDIVILAKICSDMLAEKKRGAFWVLLTQNKSLFIQHHSVYTVLINSAQETKGYQVLSDDSKVVTNVKPNKC